MISWRYGTAVTWSIGCPVWGIMMEHPTQMISNTWAHRSSNRDVVYLDHTHWMVLITFISNIIRHQWCQVFADVGVISTSTCDHRFFSLVPLRTLGVSPRMHVDFTPIAQHGQQWQFEGWGCEACRCGAVSEKSEFTWCHWVLWEPAVTSGSVITLLHTSVTHRHGEG